MSEPIEELENMPPAGFFENATATMLRPGMKKTHAPGWKGGTYRKKRQQKLTPKQRRMAQLLLQGYSARQARLGAGYSLSTSNHLSVYQDNKALKNYMESLKDYLAMQGLDHAFIAGKFKEWLSAQKTVSARVPSAKATERTDDFIEVPDYDVQIKAYDRYKNIVENVTPLQSGQQKKAEFTITQFISDEPTPLQAEEDKK